MTRKRSESFGELSRQVTLDEGPIVLDSQLMRLKLGANVKQVVMRTGDLAFMISRFNETFVLPRRGDERWIRRRGMKGVDVTLSQRVEASAGSLWTPVGPRVARFGHYVQKSSYVPQPGCLYISRQHITQQGIENMRAVKGQDFDGWPLQVTALHSLIVEGGDVALSPELALQIETDTSVAGGTSLGFEYTKKGDLLFSNSSGQHQQTPLIVELSTQPHTDSAHQN